MRRITAGLFVSLDGVAESPENWHLPYLDEEMGKAVEAQWERADTLLLGRGRTKASLPSSAATRAATTCSLSG